MSADALREAVARELFDDTPNDKHGQLCPIWTQRPEHRRKGQSAPAWTDCDCWQLSRVRHLADLALGAPELRVALARTPEPQGETALREALQRLRGYPMTAFVGSEPTDIVRWESDPNGAYVGFEDAWDIVLSALRARTEAPPASGEAKRWEALREAISTEPPVHIGQMFSATDHGATEYRADDCLYRGDVLALLNNELPALRFSGPDCGIDGCAREVGHIGTHKPDPAATEAPSGGDVGAGVAVIPLSPGEPPAIGADETVSRIAVPEDHPATRAGVASTGVDAGADLAGSGHSDTSYSAVPERNRATEAPSGGGLALDAFAEALFRVGIGYRKEMTDPLPWAVEHQQEWAHWSGDNAAAILAEAARLRATASDQGEADG